MGRDHTCSSMAVKCIPLHHSLCVQATGYLAPAGGSQLALSAALLGLQRLKVVRRITVLSIDHRVICHVRRPPPSCPLLAVQNGKLGGDLSTRLCAYTRRVTPSIEIGLFVFDNPPQQVLTDTAALVADLLHLSPLHSPQPDTARPGVHWACLHHIHPHHSPRVPSEDNCSNQCRADKNQLYHQ